MNGWSAVIAKASARPIETSSNRAPPGRCAFSDALLTGLDLAFAACEYQGIAIRHGRIEGVTGHVELRERFWIVQAFTNHPGRHQSTGLLGIEADDLELTILFIFENRCDDACVKAFGINRLEVLIGSEVDQYFGATLGNRLIECRCQGVAPESVEILARRVR